METGAEETQFSPEPHQPPSPSASPVRRVPWTAVVAWIVILAVVAAAILSHSQRTAEPDSESGAALTIRDETLVIGKILVGASQILDGWNAFLAGQLQPLAEGNVSDRICRAILIGELLGASEAIDEIPSILDSQRGSSPEVVSPEVAQLIDHVTAALQDRIASAPALPSVAEHDRKHLRSELGWYAELLLHPPESSNAAARQELVAPLPGFVYRLISIGSLYIVSFLAGLAGIVALIVVASTRGLRHRFRDSSRSGPIYAETFALWVVVFSVLQVGLSSVNWGECRLVASMVVSVISLGALFWPVLRGIPLRAMLSDIGLSLNPEPFRHVLSGCLGFGMGLVMAGIGLLMFAGLRQIELHFQPDAPSPTHPIVSLYAGSTISTIIQLFILAAVVAPISEEIMFRGVLYRHLRDATGRLGLIPSFLVSACGTSIVFAAVHPQGWTFIPVLAALAITFSFLREWRGSLLPGMIAHGLQNAITVTLGMTVLGG